MLKQFEAAAVVVVITIAIAAEVLVGLWSQKFILATMPFSNSLEPLVGWALIGLALIAD